MEEGFSRKTRKLACILNNNSYTDMDKFDKEKVKKRRDHLA